jgi:hypothetical protein
VVSRLFTNVWALQNSPDNVLPQVVRGEVAHVNRRLFLQNNKPQMPSTHSKCFKARMNDEYANSYNGAISTQESLLPLKSNLQAKPNRVAFACWLTQVLMTQMG